MRVESIVGVGVVVVAWFAAYAVEFVARLMVNSYASFGADFPSVTILALDAIRAYVPWMLAGASTALIVYLFLRKSAALLHACATAAATMAFVVSLFVLALVMPLVKCGFQLLPEWEAQTASPGAGNAAGSQARGSAPSAGCTG